MLLLSTLSIVFVTTACDSPRSAPVGDSSLVLEEDSASIRILTDGRSEESISTVSLAETIPTVEIGAVEGEEPYLFSSVGSVVLLPNRDVAVVDEGTAEVRVFDSTGAFVRTIGGIGDGPGEFRRLTALYRVASDTIVGWDQSSSRLTWLTLRGEPQETKRVDETPSPWPPQVEVLKSGAALVTEHLVDPRTESEPGVYARADSLVARIGTESDVADTVGRFAGVDRAQVVRSLGSGMVLVDNVEIPFGYRTFIRAHGDRVIVARSERFELKIFNASGELEEIWRAPGIEREITADDVDARGTRFAVESGRSDADDEYRQLLEHFPPPRTIPAFAEVLSGQDGTVWLAEYQLDPGGQRNWWVLGSDGLRIGRVKVRADLDVRSVANGVVLGVMTDELGIERVHRYEFEPVN